MCGIAGIIHKGKSSNVGGEMTAMLQALKHRGPDSTGYAVYGEAAEGDYIMRLKIAEAEDMDRRAAASTRCWRIGSPQRMRSWPSMAPR